MVKKLSYSFYLPILLLVLSGSGLMAIASSKLECIAVSANGDVNITWGSYSGSDFSSYHLYSSTTISGPYTDIFNTTNNAVNAYTHVGAGADTKKIYYYLEIQTTSGGPIIIDTLQSVFLKVSNSGTGIATLKWNTMNISANGLPWYRIFREYPANTWTLLDSTQNISYKDTVNICNATVNYRIEVINPAANCTSISSISGSLFQDKISPAVPVFDTVSIDASGKAVLGWKKNTSKDTKGYIIFMNKSGWTAIDTVMGINSTSYTVPGSNALTVSEEYRIAALDSCGNASPMCNPHNTIYTSTFVDNCTASNIINWNSYINLSPGLQGYRLFVSVDGGPLSLLSILSKNQLQYTHTNLVAKSTYCYVVQAYNLDSSYTSTSNPACLTAKFPKKPLVSYIRYVTVPNNNQVDVAVYVDSTVFVSRYDIERADDANGPFKKISSVITTGSNFYFTDNTAKPGNHSYAYRINTIDSCGNPVLYSNISQTIFLSVKANKNPNGNITNSLLWTPYQTWLGNVLSYSVYRAIDGVYDTNPIATNIPSNTVSFIDDVTNLIKGEGVFTYYVEGIEGSGNTYGFSEKSRSNTADARQDALMFIPNAFCPNGINTVFKPVMVYVETDEYEMIIFDRWGHQVFKTNDKYEGWNGSSSQGHAAEQGVYVYSINYKTALGEYIQRTGSLSLIR